jgi:carboxyl-terminal processing protease
MTRKQLLFLTFILSLLLITSFIAGYLSNDFIESTAKEYSFPILQQAHDIIIQHSISDLPVDPKMEYGMIRGMIQTLGDPHTSFSEPVQHELQSNDLHGSFGGIGVQFGNDHLGHYVLFPYPDGPASDAGILDGDRLLAIDENDIKPETPLESLLALIRGPIGDEVLITIARAPNFEPETLKIQREEIPLPSATWHLHPTETKIGIVDINIIAASTPDEVHKAINELLLEGATHFVIDLRNNSGGLLDAGIDTSRLFLDHGTIIEQRSKNGEIEIYSVDNPGEFSKLPIAIIVNQNTASAAEIIAGVLRSKNKAILIGTNTYGKDTIQLIFELLDGSSLHVSSAKWWVPDLGYSLASNGLQPDISVADDTPQLIQAAKEFFFGNSNK